MHLTSCSKVGAITTDLLSKVMMEHDRPIPDEATIRAADQHDALALLSNKKSLDDFLRLTLIQHALKDATLGQGDDREAAAARKRFADVAGKLQGGEE